MSFQKELARECFETSFEIDGCARLFESFLSRRMSQLSRQEIDLLRSIIDSFEKLRTDFHRLYVFAKYTEEV